jgi:hypothetical protein
MGLLRMSTEKIMQMTKDKDLPAFRHIQRTAKTLAGDYLVDVHASTRTAISMLVEVGGDTNHLTAILKSRHFPQGWADKFSVDPQTIVKEEPDFKINAVQIEYQRSNKHNSIMTI